MYTDYTDYTSQPYAPPPTYAEATATSSLYPSLDQYAPSAPPESDVVEERPPAFNPEWTAAQDASDHTYTVLNSSSSDASESDIVVPNLRDDLIALWNWVRPAQPEQPEQPALVEEIDLPEVEYRSVGDEVSVGYLQAKVKGYAAGVFSAMAAVGVGALGVGLLFRPQDIIGAPDQGLIPGMLCLSSAAYLYGKSHAVLKEAHQLSNNGFFVRQTIQTIDKKLNGVDARLQTLMKTAALLRQDRDKCESDYKTLEYQASTASNLAAREMVECDLDSLASRIERLMNDLQAVQA